MTLLPLILLLILSTQCQTFPFTSSFRALSLDSISDNRRANTAAAIDQIIHNDHFFASSQTLPGSSWPYGDLLAEMAEFDALTRQKTYQSDVENFYKPSLQGQTLILDRDIYGYAALQAYLAYGDDDFLKVAVDKWETALPAVLTDSDILTGHSPIKKVSVNSTCVNGSLAGGVFHDMIDPNTAGLTASATGDFLILSASLAAATSNRTYLDYATKSAEFIQRHLYRGAGQFSNGLDTQNCIAGESTFPYDTGCVIQALSLAVSLTQDTSTITFLHNVVIEAMQAAWHDGMGILSIVDNSESLAHLLRGYAEVYRAKSTPANLKSSLGSYILHQYNAVTQNSTIAGSNIYGQKWSGPPTETFSNQSQAAAISVLLGGMALTPDAGPAADPDGNSNSNPSDSVPKGAIAGGVIGCGLAIGLSVGGVWFCFRKRRRESISSKSKVIVTPFNLQTTTEKAQNPSILKLDHLRQTHGSDASRTASDNRAAASSRMQVTDGVLAVPAQSRETERRGAERGWDPHQSPPVYVE
ncbi:hypothetical protein V5O48_014603 [Marasmius crinis-equi]|uniref:Glycoside hydrolase family 76 protein n=1 Tax=Marasmius crinis-equi TaxID=585013 RepID=A0ABR3EWU7_9AGAR